MVKFRPHRVQDFKLRVLLAAESQRYHPHVSQIKLGSKCGF